jgi:hypothetical protein
VLVLIDVESAYAMAALAGYLGDERTGFSFAQNQEKHDDPLHLSLSTRAVRCDSHIKNGAPNSR